MTRHLPVIVAFQVWSTLTLSCTSSPVTVYLKVSVFAERVSPTEWCTLTSNSGKFLVLKKVNVLLNRLVFIDSSWPHPHRKYVSIPSISTPCTVRSWVVSHSKVVTFVFSNFVLVILIHSNTEDFALSHCKGIANINVQKQIWKRRDFGYPLYSTNSTSWLREIVSWVENNLVVSATGIKMPFHRFRKKS